MRSLKTLLLFTVLIVVGSGLAACDTLGPMFGSYKTQLESIIGVAVAGTYNVTVTKDGQLLVTETWDCSTDGKQLTGCHKVASRTLSTDVVAPPLLPVQ